MKGIFYLVTIAFDCQEIYREPREISTFGVSDFFSLTHIGFTCNTVTEI